MVNRSYIKWYHKYGSNYQDMGFIYGLKVWTSIYLWICCFLYNVFMQCMGTIVVKIVVPTVIPLITCIHSTQSVGQALTRITALASFARNVSSIFFYATRFVLSPQDNTRLLRYLRYFLCTEFHVWRRLSQSQIVNSHDSGTDEDWRYLPEIRPM